MLFLRIASRALVLWLLVLSWLAIPLLSPSLVLAAEPPEGEYDPWGNTTGLQESYESVIREGCATPSLECLVYHVYQFISVEMSKNVITFQVDFTPAEDNEDNEGGSLPSSRPVAIGGAVGGLATMMNGMYQRPIASSTTYIADVLESANVVTPAYAQGLGFAALDPILDLWKTFRNIAYIFFVIIFVVIGFMIMFRQKLGQTAITAQQAIPKIIIALILVTFSYAIAGFAIDLMYLTMTLIIGVFYNVLPAGNEILGYDILKLISTLVGAVWDGDANRTLISNIVGGTVNSSGLGTELIGAIGGTLLTVILAIAVLIGTVRLFFELLRCYATVVLSVVVSPLLLMMEAIPGKSAFKSWVKTLVGHLSAFPVVLMVLVMFYAFTDNAVRPTGGFMPPFMLGSGQAGNITSVMGLAIILAMPDIVQHIRKAIAPENTFASMLTKSAGANLKSGYNKMVSGSKWVANAQPFGTNEYSRSWRVSGKETALERMLIGSRAKRSAQVDRIQRRIDIGMSKEEAILPVEHAGLVGFLRNARHQRDLAAGEVGSGAGAATQDTTTRPGEPVPQRRPGRRIRPV